MQQSDCIVIIFKNRVQSVIIIN